MDRLTNSIDYCQLHCDFGKQNECFFQDKSKCYEKNIYEKLREYENLEEQGRLVKLPVSLNYLDSFSLKENKIWQRIPCHCKDCSHWIHGCAGCTEHVKLCEVGNYMIGENGYCLYAEQKLKEMESD